MDRVLDSSEQVLSKFKGSKKFCLAYNSLVIVLPPLLDRVVDNLKQVLVEFVYIKQSDKYLKYNINNKQI